MEDEKTSTDVATHHPFPRHVPLNYFIVACVVALLATTIAIGAWFFPDQMSVQKLFADPLDGVETRLLDGETLPLSAIRTLADDGRLVAQLRLGEMYRYGQGVETNLAESFKWYLAAAEQEHTEAQHIVAEMYAYGYGVKQDTAKASAWSARAESNGYGQLTEEVRDEGEAEK